ncbi:holo-ACP synthase [bacterium]
MKIESGVDIVEIKRVKRLVDKDERFVKRVFNNDEIKYCMSHKRYAEHFAVRFAAKESVIKALDRRDIPLKDISIVNTSSGKPKISLNKPWKKYEENLRVSLSHCEQYAVAYVMFILI